MQTVEIYADREYLGTTAQALCCPDTDTHRRRLRMAGALLRGVQINTLADIGCGFADLVEFLKPEVIYIGVDSTPAFIKQASERRPELQLIAQNGIEWLENCEPRSLDAVVALGVLATCDSGQMRELLCLMRRAARKIVVVSWQERREYKGSFNAWDREDVEHWLGRCKALSSSLNDTEYTGAFIP